MEPFPEERENFLQQLYKFMEDRGEMLVLIYHAEYTLVQYRVDIVVTVVIHNQMYLQK